MHSLASTFVLGYHGCDRAVGERLLQNEAFEASNNDYDWLGPGIYFWEVNPARGLEFAGEVARRKPSVIRDPFVVGAIISLGRCLDLATSAGIERVRAAHETLVLSAEQAGFSLPRNGRDLLRRHLDCAVMRRVHLINERAKEDPIDTVRGVFIEGEPIYRGSGFFEKTHIQIAVCNPACIKGVFRVPKRELPTIGSA